MNVLELDSRPNHFRWLVKKYLAGILGLFFTVILVGYLSTLVDYEMFISILQKTRLEIAVLGGLVYYCSYVTRAYRFSLILKHKNISFRQHLAVVAIHTFLNHILPFRTGELSYLYLRKKYDFILYEEATATLITVRIYDFVSLLFWFIILFPLIFHRLNIVPFSYQFIKLYFLPFSMLLASFMCYGLWKLNIYGYSIVRKSSAAQIKFGNILLNRIYLFLYNVLNTVLAQCAKGINLHLFVASLIMWITIFAYFFVVFWAFRLQLDLLASVIPAFGATLGNLLPVNGIGSLGTFEAGLSIGQSGLGIESSTSVSVAFLIHAHAILVGLIGAVISWYFLRQDHKKKLSGQ